MLNLHIPKTKCSPEINFDVQNLKFRIEGSSYPENPYTFFEPIYSWLDNFLSQLESTSELKLQLNIPYINTSSSKCLIKLLEKLQHSYENGTKIKICWYYYKEDESELDNITDIIQNLKIPIDTIGIEQ